jgi:hypothetical protein
MSSSPTRKKSSRTPKRKPTRPTILRISVVGGEPDTYLIFPPQLVVSMREDGAVPLQGATWKSFALQLDTSTENTGPFPLSLRLLSRQSPSHETDGLRAKKRTVSERRR